MDALEKDIIENGCHQCHEELQGGRLHDDDIGENFCNIQCQLDFYRDQYNGILRRWNLLQLEIAHKNLLYEGAIKAIAKANIEIRTVWDSARQAMIATGQGGICEKAT